MGCNNAKPQPLEKENVALGDCVIYGVPGSMNAASSIILCQQHRCGKMEMCMPGEGTRTPEFLAMNPWHAIPTLKDGDFCIAESNNVLRYLGTKYVPSLYAGHHAKRRGFIDWAMDRFSTAMYHNARETLYPVMGYEPAPKDQSAASKETSEHLKLFADHFLKEKFIGGGRLSIADYKVAPFFFAWEHPGQKAIGVDVPDRIRQFNVDFLAACPEAKFLAQAGGLKDLLDKGSPSAMLKGPEKPVTVETKDLLVDRRSGLVDRGKKGDVKVHGISISMNALGPILFAEATRMGNMVVTVPGEGTNAAEFLKKNPFHGIPTLEDDQYILAESNSILRYLAMQAPQYYPEDPQKRARIDWALDRWTTGMGVDAVKTLYVCLGVAQGPEPSQSELKEAGKVACDNLKEFCDFFLKERFIGGLTLSIADFKIAPFFSAYGHAYAINKCSLELPERVIQFNKDFEEACSAAKILKSEDGTPCSLHVQLDKNAKGVEETPEEAAIHKAMAAEAEELEDAALLPEKANPPSAGCCS